MTAFYLAFPILNVLAKVYLQSIDNKMQMSSSCVAKII